MPCPRRDGRMNEYGFFPLTSATIAEIAGKTGARLDDDTLGASEITGAAPVEDAVAGNLTFVDNPKYARFLDTTGASAIFVSEKFADRVPAGMAALVHKEPYRAYAKAIALLYPSAARPEPLTGETGVSDRAIVHQDATLEENVIVEAGAVIGPDVSIGRNSLILANAVIGENVQIGRGSVVGVCASVSHAYVGDGVIIHAGVRIGQDGFGFAMGPQGHRKVAQIGRVIIQDKVEIGANSTIDRGSNRDTVIGEGSKIDNLVQIGHNVTIGRHCIVVGLAGIAGSATLGDFVVIAGQVGIGGHTTVGTGAQVGGGAGTHTDIAAGQKVIGYPAMPVKDWVRLNMKLKAMISGKAVSDKGKEQD